MRVRPLHDWVLIRRKEAEGKTAGGIIIPDSARDEPAEGIVEAVGPGRYEKEPGKRRERFVKTVLKPAQRVFFSGYAVREITLKGEKITLIREADILGTLEGAGEITVKKSFEIEVKGEQPLMVQKKTGAAATKAPDSKPSAKVVRTQAEAKAKKTGKTKKAGKAKTGLKKAEKKLLPAKKTAVKKTAVKKTAVKKTAVKKTAVKKTVTGSKSRGKAPVKKTTIKTVAPKSLPKRETQKKNVSKKTVSPKTKGAAKRGNKSAPKAKKSSGK